MDIVCLSFDGNLADAVLVAAMGALMRLKLPGTRRVDDEIFVTEGENNALDAQCVEDIFCRHVYRYVITRSPRRYGSLSLPRARDTSAVHTLTLSHAR